MDTNRFSLSTKTKALFLAKKKKNNCFEVLLQGADVSSDFPFFFFLFFGMATKCISFISIPCKWKMLYEKCCQMSPK